MQLARKEISPHHVREFTNMPPIRTASMSSVTSTTTATTPAATLRHPSASPVAASSSSAAINGGGGGRSDSVKKVATSKGDEGSQPLSPSARYSDMAREGSPNGADGRGNNGEPQKQQKACIHCRKSKVRIALLTFAHEIRFFLTMLHCFTSAPRPRRSSA